jgi:hypothetical protein
VPQPTKDEFTPLAPAVFGFEPPPPPPPIVTGMLEDAFISIFCKPPTPLPLLTPPLYSITLPLGS